MKFIALEGASFVGCEKPMTCLGAFVDGVCRGHLARKSKEGPWLVFDYYGACVGFSMSRDVAADALWKSVKKIPRSPGVRDLDQAMGTGEASPAAKAKVRVREGADRARARRAKAKGPKK